MSYRWFAMVALTVALLLALGANVWAQGPAVQTVELVPGQSLVVRVGGHAVQWQPVNVATDVALPVVHSDVPITKATLYSLADGSLLGIVQFDGLR